jgi:hypothetical protein
MGIRLDLAKLTTDLELYNVLDIDGNQLLPYLIVEQNAIFHHGYGPHELIIPHLAGKPEANTYIHVIFADIDKDTLQFEGGNRSLFLVGHYREEIRHEYTKRKRKMNELV